MTMIFQFNSIQFNLFYFPSLKSKTTKPQRKKNEQMEEVQREAKACKSCTPFTKLDIPNIWKKENYVTANNTTKQSKQNKFT